MFNTVTVAQSASCEALESAVEALSAEGMPPFASQLASATNSAHVVVVQALAARGAVAHSTVVDHGTSLNGSAMQHAKYTNSTVVLNVVGVTPSARQALAAVLNVDGDSLLASIAASVVPVAVASVVVASAFAGQADASQADVSQAAPTK